MNSKKEKPINGIENASWQKTAERYTNVWLETRSGIPRPHSWEHTKMVVDKSIEVGKLLGANNEELEAIYIASLGHDAIQPGLIKGVKKPGLFRDDKLIEKMHNEWDYNPSGEESVESAKATRYVISSDSWQKRLPISQKMIDRITESIAGHSVKVLESGRIESLSKKDVKEFKDWDIVAKSLYVADKAANQEPTIFFALSNFTPHKESNERPFVNLRYNSEEMIAFLNKWFEKRAHLMEQKDLASLLMQVDPEIKNKIQFLKTVIDEYEKELEILQRGNSKMEKFLENYGIIGALKLSQELGRDEINKNEFEVASEFVNRIKSINEQEVVEGNVEKKEILDFIKKFNDKIKQVLDKYTNDKR